MVDLERCPAGNGSQLAKNVPVAALAIAKPFAVWRFGTSNLIEGVYSPLLRIPWHRHSIVHCTYVLSGTYYEIATNSVRVAQCGDLVFHPPNEVHSDIIGPEGARCVNVELRAGNAITPALQAANQRMPEFSKVLQQQTRSRSRSRSSEHVCQAIGASKPAEIALELSRQVVQLMWATVRQSLPKWLNDCLEELAKQVPERPTLMDLANRVNRHPTHVVRAFRAYLGQTPGHYVRATRIELACDRLTHESLDLAELALESGFCDQAHFCRVFRAITGITPGQFRRSMEIRGER
jgi:AraC family transcriptional regulator